MKNDTPNSPQTTDTPGSYEQRILDALPVGALLTRISDGTILFANQAIAHLLGIADAATVVGQPVPNFYWDPEDRQVVLGRFRADGKLENHHLRVRRADDSMFWASITLRPFQFEGETVILTTILDISESKQAEEALHKVSADAQAVLNAATQESVIATDPDGMITMFNTGAERMLSYSAEEMVGKQTPAILHLESEVMARGKELSAEFERPIEGFDVFVAYAKQGRYEERNWTYVRKSGVRLTVSLAVTALRDSAGNITGFLGVARDITERIQAEEELQKLASVVQNSSELVNLATLDGRMIFLNEAGSRMLGINPSKVGQHTVMEVISEEWLGTVQSELLPTVMEKGRWEGDLQYRNIQTNAVTDVYALAFMIKDPKTGAPLYLANVSRDITERKQAEQALKESEIRFRTLFEQSTDAYLIIDGGLFVECNQATVDMLRANAKADVLSTHPSELSPDFQPDGRPSGEKADEMIQIAIERGRHRFEWMHRRMDGEDFPVEVLLTPIPIEGRMVIQTVWRDLTESKRLEREIQDSFERRGFQVQISTEISQEVAAAAELSDLFGRVVTLTKERLGYYHTQLLRYDPAQDAVVLVNGYGETGQKMLAGGHKMPMGAGLIGTAAASGEIVMRSTLADDPDWQPNPLLPETKGEIAVPIKWQDTMFGVLDVQSDQAGALTEDDRLLLEGLCGQVAVAMEQTRLRQEMAERLEETNRLYRDMSREGWEAYRDTAELPAGFVYDQAGTRPLEEEEQGTESYSETPMRVMGGEVVGSLSIANDPDHPTTPEEQLFIQQVSEQVALALESARLSAQTQSALTQTERLSEASLRLARATDLQELVQVVIETLGISEINRAVVASFEHNSAGEIDSMTITANWWNGTGNKATEIGTHYTFEMIRALSLFLSPVPLFSNDTFSDNRIDEGGINIVKHQNIRAMAVLPLFIGTRQMGALILESEDVHNFTQNETRLFSALAPQIATVMENRRQFARAQKQAEREGMLNVISQKIQSATTVEAVLQIAARELGHALGAPMTIAQLSMKDKQ